MKLGMVIRLAALLLGGTVFVASCSSKTMSGTDSSTHWLDTCTTSADCGGLSCVCGICTKPCTAARDCRDLAASAVCEKAPGCIGEAAVCLKQSTTPSEGGTCPADAVSNEPCDGHIAQCWTGCAQGFREQFICSAGNWLAGHGLFPCGPDGGSPSPDAGTMTPGAGGSSAGGTVGASGAGVGGVAGAAGSGGASGSGPGGSDAGSAISYSCRHSEDCAIVPTVCCPLCRPAMLSERIGIALTSLGDYNAAKCANAGACPPCVPSDGTIAAVCDSGRCKPIDVGPYAACTTATDCEIIAKDCCACGAIHPSGWIAVSDVTGYSQSRGCGIQDCVPCPGGATHITDDSAQCTAGVCGVLSGV